MEKKIFVLGDSRTGTTSLHKFLKSAGFESIHYFFKESGIEEPANKDYDSNWLKLKDFINNSKFDAFSDYPLRTFYKDLFSEYPDAIFILSVRKNLETWRRSMEEFFTKFDIEIDINNLTKVHIRINEEIRQLAIENKSSFCEICIDDDADENSWKLSTILNLKKPISLGWENKTDAYDNSLWSTRVTLFNTNSSNVLDYVKRVTKPNKAMLSEHGWVFLVNDASNFMDYLFGDQRWTEEQVAHAKERLTRRNAILMNMGIDYLKFIIPEKAVVYPDKLPKVFNGQELNADRPAMILSSKDMPFVHYFEDLLKDVRSFGQVYFRGDSHANWYGAFFLYHAIIKLVNQRLRLKNHKTTKEPFGLMHFHPFLAAYGGDLYSQLDKETLGVFQGAWQKVNLSSKIEYLVGYTLSEKHRKAERVEVEKEYLDNLGDRETFKYTHPNKTLPKAVIFRDSTSDFLVDLLAEHFSESLFIWHKGLVYRDVIEKEQPDIVIHIMAERFVSTYPNTAPLTKLFPKNE